MKPDDPRHGTPNGYNNLGCRCSACRAAFAAYHTARRRADPRLQEQHRRLQRESYHRWYSAKAKSLKPLDWRSN